MGCGSSKGTAGGNNGGASNEGAKAKGKAKEENNDFNQTMKFLGKVKLFTFLPKDELPLLAAAVESVEFKKGQTVIKQGDTGSEFFVIKSGEASVKVAEEGEKLKHVAQLKPGDYFGENALLRDEPRSASIIAESEVLLTLKITRDKFKELGLHEKLQFTNRKAVGAGGGGRKLEVKPPSSKTEAEVQLISDALRRNENLQTMVMLDAKRVKQMTDVAWKEQIAKDTYIITEGDLNADYFYVVQEGEFEILISDPAGDAQGQGETQSAEKALTKGESKMVSKVEKGGSFGELALLYLVPRAASVKAQVDSVVWVFDRQNFKRILMQVSAEKIKEYIKYLDMVEILNGLLAEEKKAVAEALVEMHFAKDEVILQESEPGNTFYILYEGTVRVIKGDQEATTLVASRAHNEAKIFGERALMSNEPRQATVKVASETAKALALDKDSFDLLLGPLEDIMKRKIAGGVETRLTRLGMNTHGKQNDRPKKDRIPKGDLTRIGLLGCGGFGAVELYQHKVTQETYAMKALSKGYVVKTGMQESVMNEKNILMMTNSPFIISLYETYNGTQTLYFLMEPALGGELYATYNRRGLHGKEEHARFYSASTVLGFEHLHARRIIYRDLKPENLLLTDKGRLKITDMGLAKFVIGKTFTTCGTPDYFAPELIASTGHTNAVDWWTLGILIFELMSGHPPFESAYPMQIYSKVMKGINKVPFPQKCQGVVGDLIKALLKKEPSERLPMRPGGVKNLKDDRWYKSGTAFNWEDLTEGRTGPPYKPVVKSKKDIANFSARKEDMPPQIEYRDDNSGWDKDFAT